MSSDEPNVANTIGNHTMKDKELGYAWAAECKISAEAIVKLIEDGFTALEVVKLIEANDLSRNKIARGKQKLILASVHAMQKDNLPGQYS